MGLGMPAATVVLQGRPVQGGPGNKGRGVVVRLRGGAGGCRTGAVRRRRGGRRLQEGHHGLRRPAQGTAAGGGAALTAVDSLTVKARAQDGLQQGEVRHGLGRHGLQQVRHPRRHPQAGPEEREVHRRHLQGGLRALDPDPDSGKEVTYKRGRSLVDIDHLVALSDAWQKGARRWGRPASG